MRHAIASGALGLAVLLALGPAPASAFNAPSSYPPAVTPWALNVRTKVMRTLAAHPYGKAAKVQIAFKVHRDGRVSDVSVTGEAKAVAFVTVGMGRVGRLPPIPPGVSDDVIPLEVKVSFVDKPPRRTREK